MLAQAQVQILIRCDNCGKSAKVSAVHAGKRGKCGECGEPVRVPSYVSTEDAEAMPDLDDPFAATFPVAPPPPLVSKPTPPPPVPSPAPPVQQVLATRPLPWYFTTAHGMAIFLMVLCGLIPAFAILISVSQSGRELGTAIMACVGTVPVFFLTCLLLIGLDMAEFKYRENGRSS